MLKTRVSRHPDTALISRAVSRPGIDPRVWSSLAIVESVVVDETEGVFVDVTLMPGGQQVTARLGAEYAGPGFGMYCPLEKDDEVLVEAPNGDPDNGLVVVRRLHSASDPPPEQVVDHPTDVLLMAKTGATVRIIVAGSGNVVIEAAGSGKVKLGSESASRGVAREDDSVALTAPVLTPTITTLQTILDARYQVANPGSNLPPGTVVGKISSASDKVESS